MNSGCLLGRSGDIENCERCVGHAIENLTGIGNSSVLTKIIFVMLLLIVRIYP